jgi:DNA polymerase-3 subunit gamma/tau
MRLAPMSPARGPMAAAAPAVMAEGGLALFDRFEDVVELIRDKRDVKLLTDVEDGLRLARYSPGRIEFEPAPMAAPDLAARLAQRLQVWTGARWGVSVVSTGGAATLREQQQQSRAAAEEEARQNPLVAAVLTAFPGARIADIRTPEAQAAEAAGAALPEVEDEWDPFEE